jgi:hypothetical protein
MQVCRRVDELSPFFPFNEILGENGTHKATPGQVFHYVVPAVKRKLECGRLVFTSRQVRGADAQAMISATSRDPQQSELYGEQTSPNRPPGFLWALCLLSEEIKKRYILDIMMVARAAIERLAISTA